MSKKNFLFEKIMTPPQTLFDFLKEKVVVEKKIRFSDQLLENYIKHGFAKVDDRIEKIPRRILKKGQFVSIVLKIADIKKVQRPPKVEFNFSKKNILFEDEYIIVLNKPIGVPTHSTLDPDRDHLVAGLKRFLKEREGKVPYVGLHHRLDKDTSGIVLLTKQQSVNKAVGDLFAKRKIEKTYVAMTEIKNLKKDAWKTESHLARKPDSQVMQSVKSGGDLAITDFNVVEKNDKFAMIEVKPHTGRTHQIRVHLFENNLPILGDPLYFKDGSQNYPRLFLHAHKLRFKHPATNFMIEIESEIPDEFSKLIET
jgi:23S rRNA pseudouridine955/2504/2580 synthase